VQTGERPGTWPSTPRPARSSKSARWRRAGPGSIARDVVITKRRVEKHAGNRLGKIAVPPQDVTCRVLAALSFLRREPLLQGEVEALLRGA
jgi:hypothetical protein